MNCIVLAFSSPQDLPVNHAEFESVDCYGEFDPHQLGDLQKYPHLKLHAEHFEIGKSSLPKTAYAQGFIRHPDPWGEPRNWIQAIAGLGECLQGTLTCEFWYPHEIVAFHFLLVSLLSPDQLQFLKAAQIEDANEWDNFSASWKINAICLQQNMLDQYQKEKQKILQNFYNQIGKFYRETTLEEAINTIGQMN